MVVRQHDIVVAEGTFRVVLTHNHRLFAAIDAPRSPLGPLHLAFEVDRGPEFSNAHRVALPTVGRVPPYVEVSGFFDDIGKAVSRTAEKAFNTASKAATTLARPVVRTATHTVSHAMRGIAQAAPFLPAKARNQIVSAARVVARARLGDLTAKQFIRSIGQAAKAGVTSARKIGDALLDGTRLVARVADVPVHLLKHVPGVGNVVTSISPFQKFDKMIGALQRGDFRALKDMVQSDLSMAQGVISLVPGIGTGISAGISAGLAALDGGKPIEIAIRTAYGAIPIPPGLRQVTDAVLASAIQLAKGGHVTDVALAAAREKVPAGLPRDVFDTLVRVLVKKMPVQKAAGALASHYVRQYTGNASAQLLGAAQKHFDPKLAAFTRMAVPVGSGAQAAQLRTVFRPLMQVAGEDPMEYAVAGEPIADFEVAGDEPIAYDVVGEDPMEYAVAGEDPWAYAVAGEPDVEVAGDEPTAFEMGDVEVGGDLAAELAARLPHESEWRTMRTQAGE